MPSTEDEQTLDEEVSPADRLAVDLLFKRLAERGHRIRLQRQAANQQVPDDKPTKELPQ